MSVDFSAMVYNIQVIHCIMYETWAQIVSEIGSDPIRLVI